MFSRVSLSNKSLSFARTAGKSAMAKSIRVRDAAMQPGIVNAPAPESVTPRRVLIRSIYRRGNTGRSDPRPRGRSIRPGRRSCLCSANG